MFKPKLLHHRRKSEPSSPRGEAGSSGDGRMLGTRILRTVILVGVILVVAVLLHAGVLYPRGQCLSSVDIGQEPVQVVGSFYGEDNTKQVDLELFVMSKCPDAADAEATIATVMGNVGDKVYLNFTYIASYQNSSKGQELGCKHGPTECVGNRQQLCFQKYHPSKILAFITCLNRTPSQIGNSLSYTLHCADRARVQDYVSVIQPCAEADEGLNLLLDSTDRCNLLNIHTSATIRVAGKNVCIRDDSKWKDCGQLLSMGGGNVALGLQKLIEKEWKKLNIVLAVGTIVAIYKT